MSTARELQARIKNARTIHTAHPSRHRRVSDIADIPATPHQDQSGKVRFKVFSCPVFCLFMLVFAL